MDALMAVEKVYVGKGNFDSGFLGGHLASVEQAGAPIAKNIDDVVELIRTHWRLVGKTDRFDEKWVRKSLVGFLEDRRITAKAYDVYRRSLTADGYNMGMWYNTLDTSHVHSVGARAGFTNAFMANPHAIKAMPRAAVSGKLRVGSKVVPDSMLAPDGGGFVKTGDGLAPGGVLDAQKFMDEYERAVMEGGISGPQLSAKDPIREALDAKIEMAALGEQLFWRRADTMGHDLKQLAKAKEEAGEYVGNVTLSKTERAQMGALKKSVDKRLQLIETAETTLTRLGLLTSTGKQSRWRAFLMRCATSGLLWMR